MLYLKDKEKILNVRLSSDMYDYIEGCAQDYKMTKADFIRMIILWHKSMTKGEYKK